MRTIRRIAFWPLTFALVAAAAQAQTINKIWPDASTFGQQVFIRGKGFGTISGKILYNGTALGVRVTQWTDTDIGFVIEEDRRPQPGTMQVAVGGAVSNGASFAFIAELMGSQPWLPFLAPGQPFVIQGRNFGTKSNTASRAFERPDTAQEGLNAITLNGKVVNDPNIYWTDRLITFTLPQNAPVGEGKIRVVVNGQSAGPIRVHVGPVIGAISPNPAPAGSTIAIMGDGFGASGIVTFDDVVQQVVWDDHVITVKIPPETPVGKAEVIVSIMGAQSNPFELSVVEQPRSEAKHSADGWDIAIH